MPLFSIDLSEEFQSFLIVEALSAAIGIGVMKLHSGRTFVSVLGYRVSRFSDGVFIGKICTEFPSDQNMIQCLYKPRKPVLCYNYLIEVIFICFNAFHVMTSGTVLLTFWTPFLG